MRFAVPQDKIVNEAPEWRDREDRQPVSMDRWDGDHWSLLSYVEARVTECQGQLDWDRLALSRRHWPMLYAARRYQILGEDAADKYGLRLRGQDGEAELVKGCCQGDALMDLADAGLVTITMPTISPTGNSYLRPDGLPLNDPSPKEPVTGHIEWALMPWARFGLTDEGWTLAGVLRRHRADGGTFTGFTVLESEAS